MYWVLGFACYSENKPSDDVENDVIVVIDADGDGYTEGEDCDDENSNVHPGMEEICDGVDNNCDDEIDEDVQVAFYEDLDGDGFGDPDALLEACSQPEVTVANQSDCDDHG